MGRLLIFKGLAFVDVGDVKCRVVLETNDIKRRVFHHR